MQNWDQSIYCPAGQDVDSSANESKEATPCMATGGSSFLVHGGQLLAKTLIAQLLPLTARHGEGVATVDTVKPCTTTLKRLLTTLQATVALQSRFWKSKLLLTLT